MQAERPGEQDDWKARVLGLTILSEETAEVEKYWEVVQQRLSDRAPVQIGNWWKYVAACLVGTLIITTIPKRISQVTLMPSLSTSTVQPKQRVIPAQMTIEAPRAMVWLPQKHARHNIVQKNQPSIVKTIDTLFDHATIAGTILHSDSIAGRSPLAFTPKEKKWKVVHINELPEEPGTTQLAGQGRDGILSRGSTVNTTRTYNNTVTYDQRGHLLKIKISSN